MYKKVKFGELEDGREVFQYTLTNRNGVTASFLDLGGIWSSMLVPDANGRLDDVVLGYDTIEACLINGGHLGEIVGRNANRIGRAEFTLNGVTYKLAANNARIICTAVLTSIVTEYGTLSYPKGKGRVPLHFLL